MGLTVQMASRLGAYTLTDRATWLNAGDRASSAILVDGDPQLFNPYEVMLVNPSKHPHVNVAAATAFIDWLISREGRSAIASHRVNGEQLFVPDAGSDQLSAGCCASRRDCHGVEIVENL